MSDVGDCYMRIFKKEHPIMLSISISLVASVIYTIIIEPIINKYQKLEFLKITIKFILPSVDIVTITTSLITVFFIIFVAMFLIIFITNILVKNKIKKDLPSKVFCNECTDIYNLKQKNNEQANQYDNLLLEYQQALPYKKLTDCLNNLFEDTEVLESIQLFLTPKLPSVEVANSMNEINIPLKFVNGKAKPFSNTNALFNINYTFDKSIYYDIKNLFDKRNQYYSTNSKQRNPNTEKEIQNNAMSLFRNIKEDLDAIKDIHEIKNTHYASYKLLEILANVVIGENSMINCHQLLKLDDVEKQLKFGQRTGMLGAIFTESLYCFYNENSMTKKDRMYFSVPISYKQQQFILLGICNKNDLKIARNCDYVKCCEHIYEKIYKALHEIGDID